ncbi:MAG: DMT family transporter [Anaerolineales bacterium]|nr:DMT family transporter [Anaerolineales bacterium]
MEFELTYNRQMRLKADLTLLFVSMLWGSAFVFQRIVGAQGSVYYFNGMRFLLGALILLPFVRKQKTIPREQWLWMGIAGAILFVASALQQAGLQFTTAGNAGFITSLSVVIVPFVLWIGWRERPRWLAVMAIIMAGAGAYLLSTAGSFKVQKGDALELAGALFWALHLVLLGKFALHFESIPFAVGQFIIAGFLNLFAGFILEKPLINEAVIGAVVYTAMFSVGIGYTLQVWAQRFTPPTDAALILSLEAVFAVLSAWLFLSETLTLIQIGGCILILGGVLLTQLRSGKSE